MKLTHTFAILTAALGISAITFAADDENHEIIEKVMKEGLKGDDSPYAQVLDGKASKEDTTALGKLVETLKGTKAPVGDQGDYDKKIGELIEAMSAVAGGDSGEKALGRLKEAGNCKACHSKHKPKKD